MAPPAPTPQQRGVVPFAGLPARPGPGDPFVIPPARTDPSLATCCRRWAPLPAGSPAPLCAAAATSATFASPCAELPSPRTPVPAAPASSRPAASGRSSAPSSLAGGPRAPPGAGPAAGAGGGTQRPRVPGGRGRGRACAGPGSGAAAPPPPPLIGPSRRRRPEQWPRPA